MSSLQNDREKHQHLPSTLLNKLNAFLYWVVSLCWFDKMSGGDQILLSFCDWTQVSYLILCVIMIKDNYVVPFMANVQYSIISNNILVILSDNKLKFQVGAFCSQQGVILSPSHLPKLIAPKGIDSHTLCQK